MARTRQLKATLTAKDKASPVIRRLGGTLKLLGGIAATVGTIQLGRQLVQGLSAAIDSGSKFEKTMSGVRALVQPTAAEFAKLSKAAQDLGRTTVFSASQSAAAMESFALAGFKTGEIMAAIRQTLNLAAAGTLGMAQAAEITSNVLRGMGLETTDLDKAVDILAFTASNSTQNVADLGEAFKFAAPAARLLGADMSDVSSAFALLADRGIKASEAGTALRRTFAVFLGDLEEGEKGRAKFNINLKKSDGSFVGLGEALRRLKAAGVTAEQAFEIFGQRAGNAMAILLKEGGGALDEFREKLDDAGGTAERLGREKLDNLAGDITLFKSATEGASIALFEQLSPALRSVTQAAAGMTVVIAEAIEGSDRLGDAASGLADALLDGATDLINFAEKVSNFEGEWGLLARAISGAVDEIQIVLGVLQSMGRQIDGISQQYFRLRDSALNLLGPLGDLIAPIEAVTTSAGKQATIFDKLRAVIDETRESGEKLKQQKLAEELASALSVFDSFQSRRSGLDNLDIKVNFSAPTQSELDDQGSVKLKLPVDLDLGPLPEFGLDNVFNVETGKFEKINTELAKTLDFSLKTTKELLTHDTIYDKLFEQLGRQRAEASEVLDVSAKLTQAFRDQPELLATLNEMLLNTAVGIQEGINPALDAWIEKQQAIAAGMQEVNTTLGQAVDILINEGLAGLNEAIEEGAVVVESLGDSIKANLKGVGVGAALSFGDALVGAAFDGEFAFGKFFKALLRDIARSIVQALILRAILSAFGPAGRAAAPVISAAASSAFAPTFDAPGGAIATGPIGISPIGISPVTIDPGITQAALASASQPPVIVNINAEGALFLGDEAPQMARRIQDLLDRNTSRGLSRSRAA